MFVTNEGSAVLLFNYYFFSFSFFIFLLQETRGLIFPPPVGGEVAESAFVMLLQFVITEQLQSNLWLLLLYAENSIEFVLDLSFCLCI